MFIYELIKLKRFDSQIHINCVTSLVFIRLFSSKKIQNTNYFEMIKFKMPKF